MLLLLVVGQVSPPNKYWSNNIGTSRRGSNNAIDQTVTRNIEIFSRIFNNAIQQNNYVYKQWLEDKPYVNVGEKC